MNFYNNADSFKFDSVLSYDTFSCIKLSDTAFMAKQNFMI